MVAVLTKKKGAGGKVRVSFSLPPEIEAEQVAVCGEFNDWNGLPMKRVKSGEWRASVTLDPGRGYRFRYLVDGVRWENDWAADAYETNAFGSDDSVVRV
jgi:1,4-alpha-glucan branching enzyme